MRSIRLAALLWTAYVLLPVGGWGVLPGVPLRPLAAGVIIVIWVIAADRQPSTRLANAAAGFGLAALLLKVAAIPLLLEHGFSASYFANERFAPPVEKSVEYRGADVTRVDRALVFGRPGASDLPLFFFNDFRWFNFYRGDEPRRDALPFSVIWDGYAWVADGAVEREFYLRASAMSASLSIDGADVLELPHGAGEATVKLLYPRGWRHIVVKASAPLGASRDFEAGSAGRPFESETVYRAEASRTAVRIDRGVRIFSIGVDLLLIGALAWFTAAALWRGSWLLRAAALAAAEALWFAAPAAGRLILQPGGDDSLTYETYARDIVMNGPWMLLGSAPGQAEPFYYQPLYSYFVAVTHALFGDDFFGLFFLQRLSLACVAAGIWWLSRVLYGDRAGRAGLVLGIAFLYGWVDPWARTMWTEVLFVPLTVAWICLMVRLCDREARTSTAIAAGIAGGLAVLTRSTLLLAFAFAPPVVAVARRRQAASMRPLLVMIVVAVAVIGLATTRNWVASHRLVPITTSFGINLYLGNAPPDRLPVHADHAVYRWIDADANTSQVVEYLWHDPRGFAGNLARKGLYTLGVFEPLVPGASWSPVFVLTWMAALAGAVLAARHSGGASIPLARVIPALVAVSLFASVILIFPTHFRLVLPGYVPLLPYVAALAVWPWRRV